MTITLRPYQRAAIDGTYTYFDEHQGNPLVVVPTGGGKSIIQAVLIKEIVEAFPTDRTLCVTHVKELVEQNEKALLKVWPEGRSRTGVYSAGAGRRDTNSCVLFGGLQSIYRRVDELCAAGSFDLVIVDEAHLIPPKGFGMYQQLLAALRAHNPQVKLIGLTATPYRTDTGKLDEGDERLFHGVAYECSIPEMIKDGYLSDITNRGVVAEIDTSKVKLRGGEFVAGELEQAAIADDLVQRSCDELVARGQDRKAWLVFTCGVEHAALVATDLSGRGIVTGTVTGSTPMQEREETIAAFKAGDIQCLVNVNVLTTGFDAPQVDLIGLMRPTQSPGLYVQMVGRGLRIAAGKADCLVLDFGANVQRHGPIDEVRPKQPGKGEPGEAPMKKCPSCLALCYTATRECPECGHEFPARQITHDWIPDEDAVILSGQKGDRIQRWLVTKTLFSRHRKPGKPDSVRVTYLCGHKRQVSEWVCFEHEGFAGVKAAQWWRARFGQEPVPETVSDALARIKLDEVISAASVVVDTSGQYPDLKGVKFERDPFADRDAEGEPAPAPDAIDYGDIPF